jgi:hypothetical protein
MSERLEDRPGELREGVFYPAIIKDNYSIGITTFNERFEEFFKPLVINIRKYRPDIPILVAINGPKEEFDQQYRKQILSFCSKYDHIYPTVYPEVRGCSKMWNSMIVTAQHDNTLILNDDIVINEERFFQEIEKCPVGLSMINGSFSHFTCNRLEMIALGFFDERLLGFGEEDGDIVYRYIKRYDRWIPNVYIHGVENVISPCRDKSVIADDGKYSAINRRFMFGTLHTQHKWDITDVDMSEYEEGRKYEPDPDSKIKGMFTPPHTQIIPDEVQYPYEKFRILNQENM